MNIAEIKKIWEDVKQELEQTIPATSFEPWILPLEAVSFEGNHFTLITGQSIARDYIKRQYYTQFLDAFKKIIGEEILINIEYDEELSKKIKQEKLAQEKKHQKEIIAEKQQEKAIENLSYVNSMNLNLKYRFDNFVTDENNQVAKAASEAVAQNPVAQYNPLYLYGASGLGKTHLTQAIGHHIVFKKSELKVRYIKSEDFINEYINSTAKNKDFNRTNLMNKFRQKYRHVDILLIDDIQFIEGKKQCMEELFNTFDTLHNANKQIVLTSDRLPKDMPEMPERLRTRFEQGLIVAIEPPKFETRVKILENLAKDNGVTFNTDVLEYIALHFKNNVRELEGAFNKVEAYSNIQQKKPDLEFAKSVLKCEEFEDKPDISKIAEVVADYFKTTVKDFKSTTRVQPISTARAIAAYIAREKLQLSYEVIANFFNKKHQTILYSYEKIKSNIKTDKKLEKNLTQILKKLNL